MLHPEAGKLGASYLRHGWESAEGQLEPDHSGSVWEDETSEPSESLVPEFQSGSLGENQERRTLWGELVDMSGPHSLFLPVFALCPSRVRQKKVARVLMANRIHHIVVPIFPKESLLML